ncbi:unnamed protein product, partial [Nesidiocoris tenuis]
MARCKELEGLRDRFTGYVEAILELNSQLPTANRVDCSPAVKAFDDVYFEIRATETSIKTRFEGNAVHTPEVKLPPLNVPVWSGQIETFPNWFSLFKSVVHCGPYSNRVKFSYLRSLVSGPPLALISHLDLSDQNYEVAFHAIESRYASRRILATHYANKLLDFKSFSSDTLNDLHNFLNVFDTSYRAYLNVNVPDHADFFVFQCALRCLPIGLRTLFERDNDTTEIPTFDQLMRFIRDQCRIKELMSTSTTPTSKTEKFCKITPHKFTQRAPTTLLVTPSTNNERSESSDQQNVSRSTQQRCPVCSNDHSLYKCPKYLSLSPGER